MVGVFKGGDQGPVLDVLLHVGLYAAVGLADLAREAAHALDVCPAEEEGYRHDDDHHCCEAPVHGAEEEEGGQELDARRYDSGDGAGERVGDARNVAFEAVEHVTRVEGFLACPAAFHDLDEEGVLEGVPYAYLGLCFQSADDVVEEELDEGAGGQEGDVDRQTALGGARGYVDKVFADPYMEEGHCYREYADEADEQDAHTEACGCVPHPFYMVSVVLHRVPKLRFFV